MHSIRHIIMSLVFASASLLQAAPPPDEGTPAPPPSSKSFDASAIDTSADPCADFYQYACGNWMKDNPVPSDQARWVRSFSVLQERNRYLLWQLLDAAATHPTTELEKQYGDFYGACMDSATAESKGVTPLEPTFKRIAALKSPHDIGSLMGELDAEGAQGALFSFGVGVDDKDSSRQIAQIGQSGLSLPDRDYYLDDQFAAIRRQYVQHMINMFQLAGDNPEQAKREAFAVLKIEIALAQGSMARVDLRDPEKRYHIYTLADFQRLAPRLDFATYFSDIQVRQFATIDVVTPEFFRALNSLIATVPLDDWKSYFRWHALHASAQTLTQAIFDEDFAFFGKTLAGQKEPRPRWKRCTALTDAALGEAVGQDWVKTNFPPAAKDSTDKLVAALEKSLADDIRTLPWMSDATKQAAEEKLAMIRNKIGYPDKWRDYSGLIVRRDDRFGNARRSTAFETAWNLDHLGKPVDEKEWDMTPPTVNADYNTSFNDINFPAGILQPPFFDFTVDPAVNFGAIGSVIGHEITHGFDDQGSKYDGKGNLREWQTADDRKAFTERTDCLSDEYNGFEASPAHDSLPQVSLNGKLTLGENTADNGGLRIAYMALIDTLSAEGKSVDDKVDGYSEAQRYFIGFAQDWCQNQTDQLARQLATVDVHSPGRWRVNGSLRNFDAFGKAFNCKRGQPMVPANSCRVW